MNSRERIKATLNHIEPDRIPVDFGSTAISGMHCRAVEALRNYYGLEKRPVKICDVYQMLGQIDDDLAEIIGVDVIPIGGNRDIFGLDVSEFREQCTPWGQTVLVPSDFDMTPDKNGNVYVYPKGDKRFRASGVMPDGCYFINAIERTDTFDESSLRPEDNTEEYNLITDAEIESIRAKIETLSDSGKGIVASFGGMGLGDVAFIPGMSLEDPKGIRTVSEWYMSTLLRPDFISAVFEKQVEIAIHNYSKIWDAIGNKVDVIVVCGADFGTQESQFCSEETFRKLWLPHYKKFNDWIHSHTTWKTFKHSCGAIRPLIPAIIDSGFDILNPIQINAKDMETQELKKEFGADLVFWGGGIDTQKILPFSSREEIRAHILRQCEILGKDGGFVFNSVHNIQANVPTENLVAMIDTLNELKKR